MSSNENYIFYAKTAEAHVIKNLFELLQNNIKIGCFTINNKGIFFKMTDSNRQTLFDIELFSENFAQYKFKHSSMTIGLNLSHTYKMMKNIKKKDNIVLFISEDKEEDLGIRVISKDKTRQTTTFVKIQNSHNSNIVIPDGYSKPVIIPSGEYSKMIKDLQSMGGNIIRVGSNENIIKFVCNTNDIYSREIVFGEPDDTRDKPLYEEEFDTERLTRISKIAGLSSQIQLFLSEDLPLSYKTMAGNLGYVRLFVKNISQNASEEDEED
jgi:proliferating cell nuclear antigen PCNA